MNKNYLIALLFVVTNSYAQDPIVTPNNVYNIASNINSTLLTDDRKPKLENYASYNDFLHAMYIYNKMQEDQMKPRIIVNLPSSPINQPEYSFVENDSDVTTGRESIPATVNNR